MLHPAAADQFSAMSGRTGAGLASRASRGRAGPGSWAGAVGPIGCQGALRAKHTGITGSDAGVHGSMVQGGIGRYYSTKLPVHRQALRSPGPAEEAWVAAARPCFNRACCRVPCQARNAVQEAKEAVERGPFWATGSGPNRGRPDSPRRSCPRPAASRRGPVWSTSPPQSAHGTARNAHRVGLGVGMQRFTAALTSAAGARANSRPRSLRTADRARAIDFTIASSAHRIVPEGGPSLRTIRPAFLRAVSK